jgi:formylglycine-generating enzyme required for sulfatase activity
VLPGPLSLALSLSLQLTGWLSSRWLSPPGAMVRIPAATIELGSSLDEVIQAATFCNRVSGRPTCQPEDFALERRDEQARVESFFLDRTEVALGDYLRCEEAGPCSPHQMPASLLDVSEPWLLPVTMVSLEEARTYCEYASARLPTEEEFELAARGARARTYPWGDLFHGGRVNGGSEAPSSTSRGDGYDLLAPVGAFPSGRTAFGILQLAGNAAEWTSSREKDRAGQATGRALVRGGHFASPPWQLRAAHREAVDPGERLPTLGFRCARSGASDETPPPRVPQKGGTDLAPETL